MVDRLIHIIGVCPALAPQAFKLAVDEIQKGRDVGIYQTLTAAYETAAKLAPDLPPLSEVGPIDPRWLEQTNVENHAQKSKLEVELKTYTSNLIRESIRVCHLSPLLLSTFSIFSVRWPIEI